MGAHLPVELYIHILQQLLGRDTANLTTVISLLATSHVTRAAASDRTVWHGLYRARYTHSLPANEARRDAQHGADWQARFVERYTTDREALRLVARIRAHPQPEERDQCAARLVSEEMSLDVYDALEIESRLPVPRIFCEPLAEGDGGEDEDAVRVPEHALPRRFWAKTALGAILRNDTMKVWCQRGDPGTSGDPFEAMLAGLSSFLDITPHEIAPQLDALASQCRERLLAKGLSEAQLDARDQGCDVLQLAVFIRDFIREEGFAVAQDELFYHPLNQFPHYFLGPGRGHTIPLSLVYTFSAICRRFHVEAHLTNTPRKVHCYIKLREGAQDVLFDPCATGAEPAVFWTTRPSATPPESPADPSSGVASPASVSNLLARVVHNLVAELGVYPHRDSIDRATLSRASYAASALLAAVNAPAAVHVLPNVSKDCALDGQAVLMEALFPNVHLQHQDVFRTHLRSYVERIDPYSASFTPEPRRTDMPAHLFVGQVVTVPDNTLAVVTGWSNPLDSPASDTTSAWHGKLNLASKFGEQEYSGALSQEPAHLTRSELRWLRDNIEMFDRFFEDAYIPLGDGPGGRLIPTAEVLARYPDDFSAGVAWTESKQRTTSTNDIL